MKITLIGGAGWPNFGDEIILAGWLDFLLDSSMSKNLLVYIGETESANKFYGDHKKYSSINFSDDIERVANTISGLGFWEQVARGYDFISNEGIEKYSHINFDHIISSDIIHFHGGGYLNKLWPHRGFYIGLAASINEKFGARLYATGIGIGPVDEVPSYLFEKIKYILSKFEFFEVRDHEHFRLLKDKFSLLNVVYGLDDCFLVNIDNKFDFSSKSKTLFISFIEYNVNNFNDSYWKRIKEIKSNFDEVVFVESSPKQDGKVFEFLQEKIGCNRIVKVEDFVFGKVKVSKEDLVICSRFHVHYMFARAGIKGYYNQDSKYYDIKHQSIIDRGSMFMIANDSHDIGMGALKDSFDSLSKNECYYQGMKLALANSIYIDKVL